MLLATVLAHEIRGRVPWQASPPLRPRSVQEQPARAEPRRAPQVEFGASTELRDLQDALSHGSLERFSRENERRNLEDQLREAQSRSFELRARLEGVTRELGQARADRDEASREVLSWQAGQDARDEVARASDERVLSALEDELSEKARLARLASEDLQRFQSFNILTDELRDSAAKAEGLEAERRELEDRVSLLRSKLHLAERAASQARSWNLEQQRSDLVRDHDARVREIQAQAAALGDELAALELREQESRARISIIDDELREDRDRILSLEERRRELLVRPRTAPSPEPEVASSRPS